MKTAVTPPRRAGPGFLDLPWMCFGGEEGLLVPGMDGWDGLKAHVAHSAGGTPESSLLGELAKGSHPARPGTGRGHELSAPGGRLARPAALSHQALLRTQLGHFLEQHHCFSLQSLIGSGNQLILL